MKTNITITIDSEYIPELYAVLNKERMSAQELVNDDKFAEKYPNLTKRAHRAIENLTDVCHQLEDEFFK